MSIVLYSIETDKAIVEIRQNKGVLSYELLLTDQQTMITEKRTYSSLETAKKAIRKKVL